MHHSRHFLLGLASLIFAFALAVPARAQDGQTAAQPQKAAAGQENLPNPLPEIVLGKDDAPITVIEYSSLTCPHCADFHKDVLPKLKTAFIDTGKIRYIERDFPLNTPALAGAVVARCLEPAQYAPFVELLFARQSEWAFKDDALSALQNFAKQAGLSEQKFNKCIEDEDLQKKILAIRDHGAKLGVSATPTLIVNGQFAKDISFDGLAKMINSQLGK